MSILDSIAVLVTITALFSFINYRFFKLPTTIGVMLTGLLMSALLSLAGTFGIESWQNAAREFMEGMDFNTALMKVMLSFLLFAGALHVDLERLSEQKLIIASLATAGVLVSTFLVGIFSFYVFQLAGYEIPLIYCFLFGALISPTDPIAVLGILKKAGVSKSLETKITGESLFNDGIGVVVFAVILGLVEQKIDPGFSVIAGLFVQEAVGGIIFGLLLGYIAYYILRKTDQYQVEILITLAVVLGGYSLAARLHTSGPLAMVVAGLILGNKGRQFAMSEVTVEHLDSFWELVDEILNAVLFVFIGLEILVLVNPQNYILPSALMVPVVLLARYISVGFPVFLLKFKRSFSKGVVGILTWGGLRGGISIALALTLPESEERNLILTVTYTVVCFSILVQGLSLGKMFSKQEG